MAPEAGLLRRPVNVDHLLVDRALIARLVPDDLREDAVLDVRDGLFDALAAVAGAVAVTQLVRLERAGRRAGRHGGPGGGAVVEADLDLHGRVAARVEDLARDNCFDGGHAGSSCQWRAPCGADDVVVQDGRHVATDAPPYAGDGVSVSRPDRAGGTGSVGYASTNLSRIRIALPSKPDNELASTNVTGQIGCVPAAPRPGRSVRPRRPPLGAGSRPALLVVLGLTACAAIAVATACDNIAAANGATGNQEFVQEIADAVDGGVVDRVHGGLRVGWRWHGHGRTVARDRSGRLHLPDRRAVRDVRKGHPMHERGRPSEPAAGRGRASWRRHPISRAADSSGPTR